MMVALFHQAFPENPLEEVGYQIVHAIAGRVRIRIPWLETNAADADKFQKALESINFVSGVRVNPNAQSIVITYRASAISSQAAVERFLEAMQQVKPTPVVANTPPSSPAPEDPLVQMAQTVAQTVAQAIQSVTQPATHAQPEPVSDRATPTPPPAPIELTEPVGVVEIPSPWDETTPTEPSATKAPVIEVPTSPAKTPSTPVESPQSSNPSTQPELWLHSTASLAKRLNVTSQAITRRRSQTDFSNWTQKQDPEGVAWSYDATSQSFYPFTPFASPVEQPIATPSPPANNADRTTKSTKLEEIGTELIGETLGEEAGAMLGEVIGEVLMGPVGAAIGEAIGTEIGEAIEIEVSVVMGKELGAEIGKEIGVTVEAADNSNLPPEPPQSSEPGETRDSPPVMEASEPLPQPTEDNPTDANRQQKTSQKAPGKKSKGERSHWV